ncbi:hypothetical protein Ct61P_12372 [Colletotrichum tofieldiae]|nr:hypothetical protein Ct61P_12372 [Colletotrichum tofieldiae]
MRPPRRPTSPGGFPFPFPGGLGGGVPRPFLQLLAKFSECSISNASHSNPSGVLFDLVPWYISVPFGTVAGISPMPLWCSEDPHCRMAECTSLKMCAAFSRAWSGLGAKSEDDDSSDGECGLDFSGCGGCTEKGSAETRAVAGDKVKLYSATAPAEIR